MYVVDVFLQIGACSGPCENNACVWINHVYVALETAGLPVATTVTKILMTAITQYNKNIDETF